MINFHILAPVARMIKFYRVPLLTGGGLIYDYSEKKTDFDDEYHLLVKTGYSFNHMVDFMFNFTKE